MCNKKGALEVGMLVRFIRRVRCEPTTWTAMERRPVIASNKRADGWDQ